jgi:hypothetical protein
MAWFLINHKDSFAFSVSAAVNYVSKRDPLQIIGSPIILGLCPSLSAHESASLLQWVYATNLSRLQRETRETESERETSKRPVGEADSVLITAILLPQHLSCYWGKISHCSCSPILGSPICAWPLRNRDPPAKICRSTYRSHAWPNNFRATLTVRIK